jgi:large subunit ribosomal protein L19
MNRQALLDHVASSSLKLATPVLRTGMTVKVSQLIKEGAKERTQLFEGLIIATRGGTGVNSTFTVRKVVGGIGVEKVFPLHGKTVSKVEVVKEGKVRRSKLYYMRERHGKSARMKETYMDNMVFDEAAAQAAAKQAAEVKAAAEAKPAETEAPAEEAKA